MSYTSVRAEAAQASARACVIQPSKPSSPGKSEHVSAFIRFEEPQQRKALRSASHSSAAAADPVYSREAAAQFSAREGPAW